MTLPTPGDPGRAPVWENYIVAQAVQASLGLIPQNALAVGVEIRGTAILLRFQLTELTDDDAIGMDDIASELEALVGSDVRVDNAYELRDERAISPHDGVRWIFLARS